MRIVLLRHAVPVLPPDWPDQSTRPLTTEGLAAAASLAPRLAELAPAAVVSSPYLRAVQTVQPAADLLGLPIDTDFSLREWDFGYAPTPDYERLDAESWADPTLARADGESLDQVSSRAVAALSRLTGDTIVGSHGTFISRALAGFGIAVDLAFVRSMPMPAVFELTMTGGQLQEFEQWPVSSP
jgi:2,3-bisphosphoglycerate-dependent phosphoglycerate mutase